KAATTEQMVRMDILYSLFLLKLDDQGEMLTDSLKGPYERCKSHAYPLK
ncbi:hypothetical protein EVA_16052, partial [gut metagenome]